MAGTSGTRRTLCEDWDEYFMTLAFLSAKQSMNPFHQIGVCIINQENKVVSTAYNGIPRDFRNNKFYWHTGKREDLSDKETCELFEPHAEVKALRNGIDFINCTMYVTLFPCKKCTRMIIDAGIKRVVYLIDKTTYKSVISKKMFKNDGVIYSHMNKEIEIYFSCNETNQLPQTPISEDQTEVERQDQMEVDEVENN